VYPRELVAGIETRVRLFGSQFQPDSQVVSASTAGDVEVVAVKVVSGELIEATLRPSSQILSGELSLFVMNPDGDRSATQTLSIVSDGQSIVTPQ
jgi:hypothetical protein